MQIDENIFITNGKQHQIFLNMKIPFKSSNNNNNNNDKDNNITTKIIIINMMMNEWMNEWIMQSTCSVQI